MRVLPPCVYTSSGIPSNSAGLLFAVEATACSISRFVGNSSNSSRMGHCWVESRIWSLILEGRNIISITNIEKPPYNLDLPVHRHVHTYIHTYMNNELLQRLYPLEPLSIIVNRDA